MNKLLIAATFEVICISPATVFAADQTIKLSVSGMNCVSCPYMVKQAIFMVDGIKTVEATMIDRSATVVFDDAITNVDEIRQATANIGYPSTLTDEKTGS